MFSRLFLLASFGLLLQKCFAKPPQDLYSRRDLTFLQENAAALAHKLAETPYHRRTQQYEETVVPHLSDITFDVAKKIAQKAEMPCPFLAADYKPQHFAQHFDLLLTYAEQTRNAVWDAFYGLVQHNPQHHKAYRTYASLLWSMHSVSIPKNNRAHPKESLGHLYQNLSAQVGLGSDDAAVMDKLERYTFHACIVDSTMLQLRGITGLLYKNHKKKFFTETNLFDLLTYITETNSELKKGFFVQGTKQKVQTQRNAFLRDNSAALYGLTDQIFQPTFAWAKAQNIHWIEDPRSANAEALQDALINLFEHTTQDRTIDPQETETPLWASFLGLREDGQRQWATTYLNAEEAANVSCLELHQAFYKLLCAQYVFDPEFNDFLARHMYPMLETCTPHFKKRDTVEGIVTCILQKQLPRLITATKALQQFSFTKKRRIQAAQASTQSAMQEPSLATPSLASPSINAPAEAPAEASGFDPEVTHQATALQICSDLAFAQRLQAQFDAELAAEDNTEEGATKSDDPSQKTTKHSSKKKKKRKGRGRRR